MQSPGVLFSGVIWVYCKAGFLPNVIKLCKFPFRDLMLNYRWICCICRSDVFTTRALHKHTPIQENGWSCAQFTDRKLGSDWHAGEDQQQPRPSQSDGNSRAKIQNLSKGLDADGLHQVLALLPQGADIADVSLSGMVTTLQFVRLSSTKPLQKGKLTALSKLLRLLYQVSPMSSPGAPLIVMAEHGWEMCHCISLHFNAEHTGSILQEK
jgi:hypothetical protein